ncbi:MAG: hypothetical protein RIR70_1796, partial [Pseudomonadota bacterium]
MRSALRRLCIALALSAVAHAAVVLGVAWHFPDQPEPIVTNFDARLTAARREPRKVRAPKPAALPAALPAQTAE